jgi:hypothetical protein
LTTSLMPPFGLILARLGSLPDLQSASLCQLNGKGHYFISST